MVRSPSTIAAASLVSAGRQRTDAVVEIANGRVTGVRDQAPGERYDVVPGTGKLLMTFPSTRDQAINTPQPRIHIVQNWTEELKRLVPTK